MALSLHEAFHRTEDIVTFLGEETLEYVCTFNYRYMKQFKTDLLDTWLGELNAQEDVLLKEMVHVAPRTSQPVVGSPMQAMPRSL